MKSNFELADELGRLAIETIKNAKMQNKILTNLKMLFDNQDYNSLPNAYGMGLEELGMLNEWHSGAGEIIKQNIVDSILSAQDSGLSNREIAQRLGVATRIVTQLSKKSVY
jgi:hypothetical protein